MVEGLHKGAIRVLLVSRSESGCVTGAEWYKMIVGRYVSWFEVRSARLEMC